MALTQQQTQWRFCSKCHVMFFDGFPGKGTCPAGGGHQAAGFDFGLPHDVPETDHDQGAWRFCQKCEALYFDGFAQKGHCPVDGHVAAGFSFVLPHDVPETPNAQAAWRFCAKCDSMFFDGSPDKGVCRAGGGHEAAGFTFVLPHDVPEDGNHQAAWRFCGKCHVMFFDGFPEKGACPAGGGHDAIGFMFVLPHDVPETDHDQGAWRFCANCMTMFFDGFDSKGQCPASGHSAAGLTFVLPHDVPETVLAQAGWRFCAKCSSMFFDGFADKGNCVGGGGHEAAGFDFVLPHALADLPTAQASWRFCPKCGGLFFDGFPDKGICPRGGAHEAAGFLFVLPHSVGETPASQAAWRFCAKCSVMFFDGFPDKGICPAGGAHAAAGLEFVLPHDVGETPVAQANWRFCTRCHGMFFDGAADKGSCPAGDGHTSEGFNFSLPHDIREPFSFSAQLVSGGLAALGGRVTLTVHPDGTVRWNGHAHDSGADGYDFSVSAVVRTPTRRAVATAHSGSVGGTFTPGSRDHDWDDLFPGQVGDYFLDFAFGQLHTNLQFTSDFGSALEGLVEWALKFSVGAATGPAGLVIFLGVEAGSLISTGSLVPGARVVEGVLWMAGPANTLYALVAEGIASAGSRTRELSQEEYDWANNEVYQGALPPRDQLLLTDTIGPGDTPRAFTFPRFDGKITLNMGPDAFADPRNYPNRRHGEVFVHELLHACQIASGGSLSLLAGALSAKVCEVTGADPYIYPPAGVPYTELGLEQQAQIVSDWFAGLRGKSGTQTGIPKDMGSPYFTYIVDNVRTRTF